MYYNKRCKTFCIVINNVLSIVINIQNTTIFEPVILTGFYTSKVPEKKQLICMLFLRCLLGNCYNPMQ